MNALTDWLFERTPSVADPGLDLPAHLVKAGYLPDPNEPDEFTDPIREKIQLEEVFTVIDYTDSLGNLTRRRVTCRSIEPVTNGFMLTAICHERRAVRSFRIDRIDCFIDPDGEAMSPLDFFEICMGIPPGSFAKPERVPESLGAARAIRDELRAPLSILVAFARADHDFIADELDAICDFVEQVVPEVKTTPHPGDLSIIDALRPIINNMRPSRESLAGYMADVRLRAETDADFRDKIENAISAVISADGHLSTGEARLLEKLGVAVWRD